MEQFIVGLQVTRSRVWWACDVSTLCVSFNGVEVSNGRWLFGNLQHHVLDSYFDWSCQICMYSFKSWWSGWRYCVVLFLFYNEWTNVIHVDHVLAGGTFALYSLLCRHMNIAGITSNSGMSPSNHSHHNNNSNNLDPTLKKPSRLGMFIERSLIARRVLFFIAILGMCMLIGDGILTPAISGLFLLLTILNLFHFFLLKRWLLKIRVYNSVISNGWN